MASSLHLRIIAAAFVIFLLTFVSCDPDSSCVPQNCVDDCKRAKCQGVNRADCQSIVSPYIGGNQCCNNETLNAINQSGKRSRRQAYNFDQYPSYKWTSPIPYFFNTTIVQDSYKATIQRALSHIQAQTCIQFTQMTTEPTDPHIVFSLYGLGCVSFVGKSQVPQSPILATTTCLSDFGEMLYLVVQTLGLWHQTQRSDRDNYVTINTTNMDASHIGDFQKIDPQYLVTFGLPYDYASILQYPGKVFTNNGQLTILTKDPLYERTLGQRVELSFQDALLINKLYCPACKNTLTCQNGGYQDPNNCAVCRCPGGFAGNLCQSYDTDTSVTNCGGELVASPVAGNLTSPGYDTPGYYSAYSKCTWHITAPKGGNISLQFTDSFGIYANPNTYACQHWVEIKYQGSLNNTGPRFCGPNLPADVLVSSGRDVIILFRSNYTDQGSSQQRGFKISYRVVNAPPCAYVTCNNGGVCSNGVCQCAAGYNGPTCDNVNTPTAGSGSCQPNPCRNNGTCVVNGTGFTCQCLPGLTGARCEHAMCGGCDAAPGPPYDSKCILYSNPAQTCMRQDTVDTYSYNWWGSRSSCRKRQVSVSYTCFSTFCCDNAVDIGGACATMGWSNWSLCDQPCGGGHQYKYNYGLRTMSDGQVYYTTIDSQQQSCNTQTCPPPPPRSSCGFWSWLCGRC